MLKIKILLLGLWILLACNTQKTIAPIQQTSSNSTQSTNQESTTKIFDNEKASKMIFVGNSQTYVNNVPKMVQEISELELNLINITTFALPNYSLKYHWSDGDVQIALDRQKFDYR